MLFRSYTLYRLNNQGLQRINPDYIKNMDGTGATKSFMATNNISIGQGSDIGTSVEASPSSATPLQTDIKKPAEYDSWNPNLKKYIENLPPSVQQQIFQKAEELKQNGQDINTYFDTYAKTNNVPMQAAAQATATAIIDSPPGELPSLPSEQELIPNQNVLPKGEQGIPALVAAKAIVLTERRMAVAKATRTLTLSP